MGQPVKHHYLPVFYLSRWAGSDGRVCRFHRPYRSVVVSQLMPEYTGFENGLYSLQGVLPADRQKIETDVMTRAIDTPAAPLIERLVLKGAVGLSGDERSDIARFFMSLELRNPQAVKEIRELATRNIRSNLHRIADPEYQAAKGPDDPETLYDWAMEKAPAYMADAHLRFLPGLIDHAGIGQHLISMPWTVLDLSRAPITLLTCDRPMVRTHGLGDPRAIVAIPLSPTKLFAAANVASSLVSLSRQPARETVRKVNSEIVSVAVQNVFGSERRHRAFIEHRLIKLGDKPIPGVAAR